jgi:hypothetical protein
MLILPEAPESPADPSDNIAMAGYLTSLQNYQEEVNRIQALYKADIENYQALGEIYKDEATEYQTKVTQWRIDRLSAINSAEGLIAVMYNDFGWTFINKDDNLGYYQRIILTWMAQGILIVIMAGITLIFIKRKDAI